MTESEVPESVSIEDPAGPTDPCVLHRDVLNREEQALASHRKVHGPNAAAPLSQQSPVPTYPRLADERKKLVEAVTRARTQYRLCMEANGLPLDRDVSPADPR